VPAVAGRAADLAALEVALHRELVGRAPEAGPGATALRDRVRALAPLLPLDDAAVVAERVAARLYGLGPLDALLSEPGITEVMVNPGGAVWVERDGELRRTELVLDEAQARLAIERVVAPLGLRADPSAPVVDARLPDGSRVHAVLPPVAVDGPCLTIRRFAARAIELEDACSPTVAALLRQLVDERRNLVVSGGTGAGKTTLLNALAGALPPGERIVTIEDAAELRLPGEHVVRLEARPATADGLGAVGVRELVRTALRMRPDRIVVGEVRGGEAFDMVQAMNTGHEGSLSTCHANGPLDALRRLEAMIASTSPLPLAAVRDQLEASLDVVVHVARVGGRRRVTAVAEVVARRRPDDALGVRLLADGEVVRAAACRPARRREAAT
jgi:pilus assembly protein CpaF